MATLAGLCGDAPLEWSLGWALLTLRVVSWYGRWCEGCGRWWAVPTLLGWIG